MHEHVYTATSHLNWAHFLYSPRIDQSYSVEVLTFFSKRLGHLWTEYAAFLGFTAKEIHTVKSYSDGIEGQEPRHFLKVWRMPDLQSKDNNDILYSVLPKAGINIGIATYAL